MAISTGAALLGAAVIGAGSTLFAASSAKKAAKTQAAGYDQATALQREMYQTTRRDLRPWRKTGGVALTELADLYGLPTAGRPTPSGVSRDVTREDRQEAAQSRFFTSPGYEFTLGEGERAINRYAASRGKYASGAAGRQLTRYATGLASQEFGNYANRLANFAGMGQTAATNTGRFGASAGANMAQYAAGAGTARASGYTGAANAITGGIQDFAYGAAKYLQPQQASWMNPDTGMNIRYGAQNPTWWMS